MSSTILTCWILSTIAVCSQAIFAYNTPIAYSPQYCTINRLKHACTGRWICGDGLRVCVLEAPEPFPPH